MSSECQDLYLDINKVVHAEILTIYHGIRLGSRQ